MTAMKLMTVNDLLALPADHLRHELIAGELTTMAPSNGEHGIRTGRLALKLGSYIDANNLGVFFGAETGFIIARNPDTVRAPDFAFVKSERLPAVKNTQQFWAVAPDLVVEVLSPSDSAGEVLEKISEWLAAGTSLVWVVDPTRKNVKVYAAGRQSLTVSESDMLDGENVLPGLKLPVSEIFR